MRANHEAHKPTTVIPCQPGEQCVAHSRLDCHDCSQPQLVQKFPSTARWVNGEYVPDPVNQPNAYAEHIAHNQGQLEHISEGNGLNGSPRG